jgi:hypothetical protein
VPGPPGSALGRLFAIWRRNVRPTLMDLLRWNRRARKARAPHPYRVTPPGPVRSR